jgi:CDP-L-myo-inositol myo-inositolphosphotransferase
MKAVILAAGNGSRLGGERPKPLTRLFGVPLVDRTLDALARTGLKPQDIIVVYSDPRVKDHLEGRAGLVYNDRVDLEGGHSLLLGAEAAGEEPFLLLMADHVFDPGILGRLLESGPSTTTLCVDRTFEGRDLEEATKVLVRAGSIQEIGKDLEVYTALDTGIFYCTPEVLEAARRFRGRFTVSDVMASLARRGRLSSLDVTGSFWQDIDTKEDIKRAERTLSKSLAKATDGLVSRHLNRRLSIPLSRLLVRTPVTPNQITVFSFLLGLASAALFAQGRGLIAGLLAQVSSIIDGCDGEVARMKAMGSRFGGYLDSLLDRYADVAIILGMVASAPEALWHVGGLALLGTYSISYSVSRMEGLTGMRFNGGLAGFMTRDVRLFIIMLGGILNQMFLTLGVLGVLTNLVVLSRIVRAKRLMETEEVVRCPNAPYA